MMEQSKATQREHKAGLGRSICSLAVGINVKSRWFIVVNMS